MGAAMKLPGEIRADAQRLLKEANSTTDKNRRSHLLARALTLATEAEISERESAGAGPDLNMVSE
jgi:hypothetical protein